MRLRACVSFEGHAPGPLPLPASSRHQSLKFHHGTNRTLKDASASETLAGRKNLRLPERGYFGAGMKLRGSLLRALYGRVGIPHSAPQQMLNADSFSRGYMLKPSDGRSFHSATVLENSQAAAACSAADEETLGQSAPPANEALDIATLPITRLLIDALARRGITKLFPVQRAVLEPALRGQDLIVRAKTGTGKTLAFGIPILDRIIKENANMTRRYGKAPLAIVMAPTRELAKQVENEFKLSGPSLDILCVYGGSSIDTQVRQLQRGVDVVVGTPGRITDLLERRTLNLGEIKYVILDEADRMLAVGFVEAIQKIFQYFPAQRQSLLFSATMPNWVKDLAKSYLRDYSVVDLVGNDDEKLAEGIKLLSLCVPMDAKRAMLRDLITVYGKGRKVIVFTQTKRDADDVAMNLNRAMPCEPLHGDITQFQREKTLKAFRDGELTVLVATDVAARGLDIPNVDLVIHYEPASDPETFVHRSGRTGRAGKEGTAILMHTTLQMRTIDTLQRELGCRFQTISPPTGLDVLNTSVDEAATKFRKVEANVKSIFLPIAERLLAEQGPRALAAALAHTCGLGGASLARSLISHEQGMTTLKITCPSGVAITTGSAVTQFLSRTLPTAATSLGKVRELMGSEYPGAVFDLPEKMAKDLLATKIESGEIIESLSKLPEVVEEPLGMMGRPARGGFGGRVGGGFSSGGGGGFFRNSSSGGNFSRPNRYGGGGGGGYNLDLGFNNSSSAGSSALKCSSCGQPGHFAFECPSKAS